jgi:hypothetical protein
VLKKVAGYAPLWLAVCLVVTLPFLDGVSVYVGAVTLGVCAWLVFRNTLDLVQGVGPVYWLTRQTNTVTLRIQFSFMRETDYPWRTGRGMQFVVPYRSFQVGLCQPSKHYSLEEGLLHSLVARKLDKKPGEIAKW